MDMKKTEFKTKINDPKVQIIIQISRYSMHSNFWALPSLDIFLQQPPSAFPAIYSISQK